MHSRPAAEYGRRAHPPGRNIQTRVARWYSVGAREAPHERPGPVEDLERDRSRGGPRQVVIEYRAVGRILADRLVDREGRIGVLVPAHADGTGGPVEIGVGRRRRLVGLAQRREVVEDPEAAAVRADDQIAVVYDEVAHGGGR